jgi:hypothetical protein
MGPPDGGELAVVAVVLAGSVMLVALTEVSLAVVNVKVLVALDRSNVLLVLVGVAVVSVVLDSSVVLVRLEEDPIAVNAVMLVVVVVSVVGVLLAGSVMLVTLTEVSLAVVNVKVVRVALDRSDVLLVVVGVAVSVVSVVLDSPVMLVRLAEVSLAVNAVVVVATMVVGLETPVGQSFQPGIVTLKSEDQTMSTLGVTPSGPSVPVYTSPLRSRKS